MPRTGEKPGKGEYTCDDCGQVVVLDDDSDTMPPCPTCNSTNVGQILYKKKALSTLLFGLYSSNVRNTMQCHNCGYKW